MSVLAVNDKNLAAYEIGSQSLAMTTPHQFSFIKNLVKTFLPSIDNQYTVLLCQDLPEAIAVKFNKFTNIYFLTGFFVFEFQYFTKFLSGFVSI
jgi:hypothetical protein